MAKSTPTQGPRTSEETNGGDWNDRFKAKIEKLREQFRKQPPTPLAAREYEKDLKAAADEAMREVLGEDFNQMEPSDKEQMPQKVRYKGETYRINKRTKAEIASTFGSVTVWSFLYLCEEPGEPGLHPLHVQLGIVAGSVTSVVAERVARWAVDCSQSEVRQLLESEHGLRWSNDRLRRVLREYRRNLVVFRAEAQVQRLLQWLDQAERSRGRHRPVLAVGRDGVMVPMRVGFQEASAGTVSVYDRRRKRLGTVYLGRMPEAQQVQMTEDLTALVKALLKDWTGPLPRLAYITDKGKTHDTFYQKVLRRMYHPRDAKERLHWEWVLDFYHVCGYLGKMREALFKDGGYGWFERMRGWLRDRDHGVAHILRSAKQLYYGQKKMSESAEEEFWKAYWYLRNNQRWMNYPRYRRQGLPIGSGVTEAACKTVFTQRLKRSGMRWNKDSAQVIVDLRILHLSGIWDEVVRRDLSSRQLPERVSGEVQPKKIIKRAA